jgi:NCS1 family nucleobase:cation symporter-1
MEWVRHFIDFCGPAVYIVMFVLAGWMLSQAGWSAFTLKLSPHELTTLQTVELMVEVVALVIAYFAALLLNFADFTRFGTSVQAVKRGNFYGLPINYLAFSLVTVIVTASTVVVFGEAIMDPVKIIERVQNKPALIIGCLTLVVSTIGINIVANFVSAAYDIANVAPRYITFTRGGFIAGVLSIAVLPWQLYHNPAAISLFVGGLGACLGPLFGVIMVDHYWTRRKRVVIADLYRDDPGGRYWFNGGVNYRAIWAFLPAAIIAFLIVLSPGPFALEAYGWIIGTILAGLIYAVIMPREPAIEISTTPITS